MRLYDSQFNNDKREASVDVYCSVYNHGKYLREALDSIIMQETTYPVNIIIHDDASTDDSACIIREYAQKYPDRITAIIEEENLYQNGKSEFGKMLPYFTSKYIAICEGDDYWIEKDKLEKQISYLEANPDSSAAYHNILPVNEYGEYDESVRGGYCHLKEGDYSKRDIRKCNLITQTASLVMRNFYPWMSKKDIEVWSQIKCNGDEKNLMICGLIGRVHYLPDVMAAHRRVFNSGDSWTAYQSRLSEERRIIELHERLIERRRFYEYFSGRKIYKYNQDISDQISLKRKCPDSSVNFIEGIPLYAYIVYIPVFSIKAIRFASKKVFRYKTERGKAN